MSGTTISAAMSSTDRTSFRTVTTHSLVPRRSLPAVRTSSAASSASATSYGRTAKASMRRRSSSTMISRSSPPKTIASSTPFTATSCGRSSSSA